MRHQPGQWNAIWSDMYIESTFMRYGHSPGSISGITLKPSTLKRWALSLHLCSQIVRDVSRMKDESRKVSVTVHKEKMPARNKSDAADRETLRERRTSCIEPLNPDDHPNHFVIFVCAGSWKCQASPRWCTDNDQVWKQLNPSLCNGQMQLYHSKTPMFSVLWLPWCRRLLLWAKKSSILPDEAEDELTEVFGAHYSLSTSSASE